MTLALDFWTIYRPTLVLRLASEYFEPVFKSDWLIGICVL
jgi:hypothetical protein